jgi:hypothetical protein
MHICVRVFVRVFVSVAVLIHCAKGVVICGLSGTTILFHIITQMARFSKKNLNKNYVFLFSVQVFAETFLIIRRV